MKVIKNGAVVEDDWQLVREPEESGVPGGKCIVPFQYWLDNREALDNENTTFWINGDIDVERVAEHIDGRSLIALDFPAFTDGRCYSHARLLRERYGYEGDLRAIGDVLRDQLFYMRRCGFDSFQLREDKDYEDALTAFNDFSVTYQAACDEPLPLYRRR